MITGRPSAPTNRTSAESAVELGAAVRAGGPRAGEDGGKRGKTSVVVDLTGVAVQDMVIAQAALAKMRG